MAYRINLGPVEIVKRSGGVDEESCACVYDEGNHREVVLGEQRPSGLPVPQTGSGENMAAVNSQGPRQSDPGHRQSGADPGPPLLQVETSDRRSSSSSSTSSNWESLSSSQRTDVGVDCAGVVLDCLFCRFYDMLAMVPASCERAAHRCCPSYKHVGPGVRPGADEVQGSSLLDCDCGLLDACQDTSECLELAMEMSELCYH